MQIKGEFDLVHAHYGFLVGLLGCFQRRVPLIVTMRGSDVNDSDERPVTRIVARRAQRVLVMSEEMRQSLECEDAVVLPYGIDVELFRPIPRQVARETLNLRPDIPYILFPYDIKRPIKRFHLAEQAVAQLQTKYPDLQLITISQEPHERVMLYANACDVLLLCSASEGAPVAIREAMACNLPIVSTAVGDVPDLIAGLEQCYISSDRPNDIADNLNRVLEHYSRSNGRTRLEQISGRTAARKVRSIYNELLANKASLPLRKRDGKVHVKR